MKKGEIINFNLNLRIPQTLSAELNGRVVSVGLALVPKVMESKGLLSFEEEVKLAMEYLKILLKANLGEYSNL